MKRKAVVSQHNEPSSLGIHQRFYPQRRRSIADKEAEYANNMEYMINTLEDNGFTVRDVYDSDTDSKTYFIGTPEDGDIVKLDNIQDDDDFIIALQLETNNSMNEFADIVYDMYNVAVEALKKKEEGIVSQKVIKSNAPKYFDDDEFVSTKSDNNQKEKILNYLTDQLNKLRERETGQVNADMYRGAIRAVATIKVWVEKNM